MLITLLLFSALARVWRRWRDRDRASLRDLDARTLADIGVDPSEIASIEAESRGDALPTRRRVVTGPRHA